MTEKIQRAHPQYAVIFEVGHDNITGTPRAFPIALTQTCGDAQAVLRQLPVDRGHHIVRLSDEMPGVDIAPWIVADPAEGES